MISQKIKSLLWPIVGLDLEPTTPEGEARIEGNLQPTLGYLVGKIGDGSVLIEGTVDGAIKVADTGSGLDTVEVASGFCTDTLTDLSLSSAFTSLVITVENNPLQITFETSASSYSGAVDLSVGVHVRDISALDMQVRNAITASISKYQIEAYS